MPNTSEQTTSARATSKMYDEEMLACLQKKCKVNSADVRPSLSSAHVQSSLSTRLLRDAPIPLAFQPAPANFQRAGWLDIVVSLPPHFLSSFDNTWPYAERLLFPDFSERMKEMFPSIVYAEAVEHTLKTLQASLSSRVLAIYMEKEVMKLKGDLDVVVKARKFVEEQTKAEEVVVEKLTQEVEKLREKMSVVDDFKTSLDYNTKILHY